MRVTILASTVAFSLVATAAFAMLKKGDAAPDFSLQAAQGGRDFVFSLKDALKKGPVVLYFYPKSFTSVCTEEAHEFAEAMDQFAELNASVIGVSGDKIETQREFSVKECRDEFPVGADPDFKVIKAYDASFETPIAGPMFASRISYVISPQGKILSAVSDPGATKHIESALEKLRDITGKR